jgi:hypothetical protein
MDLRPENINWNCPAGKQLDRLASLLPGQPRLDLTVFGSAPLQLFLSPDFLSQNVDVYTPEENWGYLSAFVESNDLGKEKSVFYVEVCDPRAFRGALDWRERAVECERHGHLFRFVHPWDVLVSKLQRLDAKDIEAFQLVVAKTGRPTEADLTGLLQKAVDLYRPRFDEESNRGDMLSNTGAIWRILWNKDIDVRAAIIRPALESARHDSAPADSTLKTRRAELKMPPK